jgi:hypothetical protein
MFEPCERKFAMSILRMKAIFAVLVLAAVVGVVPQANAQNVPTPQVIIAGSSAMWQTMALGAYNSGTSIISGGGNTCHWTSKSNVVNLVDSRTTTPNIDPGTMWVVWDNNTTGTCDGAGGAAQTHIWAYLKVDSVVGLRCWFAVPQCTVNGTAANLAILGNQITLPGAIWGGAAADQAMPSSVLNVFTGTTPVSVAATDIRPEDGAFAVCRVNSTLGAGKAGGAVSDGLDGLGYNKNNAAGVCPVFAAATAQAKGLGNPILSGVSIIEGGTTVSQANVLAFNISGHDPITNGTVPAYTVTTVGAAPIVFVFSRQHALTSALTNATDRQLQQVFSGASCNASEFGLPAGAINVFLREPLSGTMNTTEANVFRRPTVYPKNVLGLSQETGVNPATSTGNPLNLACAGGSGERWRGIGTGEVVKGVKLSPTTAGFNDLDGIAYTFFSYGNVSSIASNSGYGYLQLDGIDPIFQSYGAGTSIDPGQPTTQGNLPGVADLPASCAGAFPCAESAIWGNGFSFPNLRNGTYRAWSLLRMVATGAASTNIGTLVTNSNKFVVTTVPDYVPAAAVAGTLDLGVRMVRSHYQQRDGAGTAIGPAPHNPVPLDKGGDMGGMIIPTFVGVSTANKTNLIQNQDANNGFGPVLRK